MDTLLTWLIAALVLGFFVVRYWRSHNRQLAAAQAAKERGEIFSGGPSAQHPQIDLNSCIGCGACVTVCPEGDVLGLIGGKAAIINGHKCIGHSLCAEECPVGAITMVTASAGAVQAGQPILTPECETSIPNLFIAGELGGLALIRNAVAQGKDCVDLIAARLPDLRSRSSDAEIFDLIVVGAGPAGISASLRAAEHKLRTLTLERDTVGGTVSKYPRQKLVMTSPVEFPLYGKFRQTQLSKEQLLAFWDKVMQRTDLNIHAGESVATLSREADGLFHVKTPAATYRSHAVVLAVGKAGTPRRLGVAGEDLPHVMYRLIEADHYTDHNILVVGGGDSAVEAAMGLAEQRGNRVTIVYRGTTFTRLKDRNMKRIEESVRSRRVEVLYNSTPREFRTGSVIVETDGQVRELANDFVWIFAGGTSPAEFLKAMGIQCG
ncbi:MAG TPA: NAD(P)-binding domain-containing protein [Acidobacteriaceae bacterium]|nr:NAD(P)-binding domain-containing protein [Acidobacteriaceae bacterium]